MKLEDDGSCVITIAFDGITKASEFTSTGRGVGGARLRWPEISFAPAERAQRKDALSADTKEKIQQHYEAHCPTSPCTKHRMRKWLSVGIFLMAQAMVLMTTFHRMFCSFEERFGNIVSERVYTREQPWNVRRAGADSCLCKPCENYKLYEDALDDAMEDLEAAYRVDEEDVESGDLDDILQDANYKKLLEFVKMDRRIDQVKSVLCKDAFNEMKMDCIKGACSKCGFKEVWSQGLRKTLVTDDNELDPSVNPVWLKERRWWRYKTSKASASSSAEDVVEVVDGVEVIVQRADLEATGKQTEKQQRKGSIIQLLDDFKAHTMSKYPFHRCSIVNMLAFLADNFLHGRYTLERTRQSAH